MKDACCSWRCLRECARRKTTSCSAVCVREEVDLHVENTVTTSNLEALEVDLNGTMSNHLLLSLPVLTYFLDLLHVSPEYVNMIKRLCRKLLYAAPTGR